jgi:hypothetical protein
MVITEGSEQFTQELSRLRINLDPLYLVEMGTALYPALGHLDPAEEAQRAMRQGNAQASAD